MRKKPEQKRAIATVDAILQAATQFLQEGDLAKLTTNFIAERAGVSIGTLYQYFPDGQSILVELGRRESRDIAAQVVREIEQVESAGPEQTIRNVVRLLIAKSSDKVMGERLRVLRTINQLRIDNDEKLLNRVAETISAKLSGPDTQVDQRAEMYSFVLTRSVLNVIRSAMLEKPDYLRSPDFEDMIVEMVMAFRTAHYGEG